MSAPHPGREEIVRLLLGEHADAEAIASHLAACPECAAAHRRLRPALSGIREGTAGLLAPAPWAPPVRRVTPLRRLRIGAAAAAALVAAGWLLLRPAAPVVARVETGSADLPAGREIRRGEALETREAPVRLRFPDGSLAWLDRRSRAAAAGERALSLSEGRLHVRTAGGAGFSVGTPAGRAIDLGTVFLVDATGTVPAVTVVRGRVRLEPAGGAPLVLAQGQMAPISAAAGASPADVPREAAWVRSIVFPALLEDEPLEKVFALLEDVTGWRIEAPESLRRMHVTGSVAAAPPADILAAVSALSGAPHRVEAGRVVFAEPPGASGSRTP